MWFVHNEDALVLIQDPDGEWHWLLIWQITMEEDETLRLEGGHRSDRYPILGDKFLLSDHLVDTRWSDPSEFLDEEVPQGGPWPPIHDATGVSKPSTLSMIGCTHPC